MYARLQGQHDMCIHTKCRALAHSVKVAPEMHDDTLHRLNSIITGVQYCILTLRDAGIPQCVGSNSLEKS